MKLFPAAHSVDWYEEKKSDRKWTVWMTNLLYNMGHECFSCHNKRGVSKEFYKLDISYYSILQPVNGLDINWNLEVAIEHENNLNTWYYEVVKLAHLNCGLKVLIGYYDSENGYAELVMNLNKAKDLIMTRAYQDRNSKWLFIFGNLCQNHNQHFKAWTIVDNKLQKVGEDLVVL